MASLAMKKNSRTTEGRCNFKWRSALSIELYIIPFVEQQADL